MRVLIPRHVPDQPQKTLGGSVLLGLELITAQVLDVLGLGGGSKLAIADFLRIPVSVIYVTSSRFRCGRRMKYH